MDASNEYDLMFLELKKKKITATCGATVRVNSTCFMLTPPECCWYNPTEAFAGYRFEMDEPHEKGVFAVVRTICQPVSMNSCYGVTANSWKSPADDCNPEILNTWKLLEEDDSHIIDINPGMTINRNNGRNADGTRNLSQFFNYLSSSNQTLNMFFPIKIPGAIKMVKAYVESGYIYIMKLLLKYYLIYLIIYSVAQ